MEADIILQCIDENLIEKVLLSDKNENGDEVNEESYQNNGNQKSDIGLLTEFLDGAINFEMDENLWHLRNSTLQSSRKFDNKQFETFFHLFYISPITDFHLFFLLGLDQICYDTWIIRSTVTRSRHY